MRAFKLVAVLALSLTAACTEKNYYGVLPEEPTLSLNLNMDTVYVGVGKTVTVTATTQGADQVNWSSPNPAILSLVPHGKSATITAVSSGIGRVVVYLQADQNKRDTVVVVVSPQSSDPETPEVHGISMSGGPIHGNPGKVYLRDVVVTADADSLKGFTCNSSNPGIVSVLTLLAEKKCKFTIFGIGTAEVWAETLYAGRYTDGTTDRFRSGFLVTSTVMGTIIEEVIPEIPIPLDVPVEIPLTSP
jgi:hypothetical protein